MKDGGDFFLIKYLLCAVCSTCSCLDRAISCRVAFRASAVAKELMAAVCLP